MQVLNQLRTETQTSAQHLLDLLMSRLKNLKRKREGTVLDGMEVSQKRKKETTTYRSSWAHIHSVPDGDLHHLAVHSVLRCDGDHFLRTVHRLQLQQIRSRGSFLHDCWSLTNCASEQSGRPVRRECLAGCLTRLLDQEPHWSRLQRKPERDRHFST